MSAANYYRYRLAEEQRKLTSYEADLHGANRLLLGGLAVSGTLAGIGELVPNESVKTLLNLGAVASAFFTAVGPGLDALSMKLDFVNPGRREVGRLEKRLAEESSFQSELDLGI